MMLLRAIRTSAPLLLWLLLLSSEVRAQDSIPIVQSNSFWKYFTGTNAPTDWNQPDYDDAAWRQGRAQLGYGDGDENTVIEAGSPFGEPYITTYFRHTFDLTDPPIFSQILLGLLRDDGGVVYLNGLEVFRSNLPDGVITNGTLATNNVFGLPERTFFTQVLPANALQLGQNVLAVEIHQYGENGELSDDLSFDLYLSLTNLAPDVVRGPYLQSGSSTSVVVRWRTSIPTDSIVWYGLSPGNLDMQATDPTITNNHIVTIQGLSPDTKYYYGVGWSATVDWPEATNTAPNYFFTTAPVATRPIRIWAIGDAGTADSNQRAVRNAFYTNSPAGADVWLMLGDNAYGSGTDSQYQRAVFQMYTNILPNTLLYPALGNHETYFPNNPTDFDYLHIFSLPVNGEAGGLASGTELYYSFDYGNIHFVCLDSMTSDRSSTGAMALWLDVDLALNTNEWLIAYWHHPPYSKGSHDSDNASGFDPELVEMRENILPILERYGVDLVLCGHSHAYERSYLLNGHYGYSTNLAPSMVLDSSSGANPFPYTKTNVQGSAGAVYVVAGSSGQISGGPLDHPAMFLSLNELGSLVIDVNGPEATVQFLRETGEIDDQFTLRKVTPVTNAIPELVRGPYLQSGSTTGVVVRWRTSVPTTNAYVRYGTSSNNLTLTNFSLELTNDHTVALAALEPDTEYFYLLGFGGYEVAAGGDFHFRTAPLTNRPIRIWAIGDAGTANTNQAAVRDAFYNYSSNRPPDVWLMLGDNAYPTGTDDQYQAAVFRMYEDLLPNTFLYPALGNHETYPPNNTMDFDYLHIFSLPRNGEAGGVPSGSERFYSFDYGNIHFVCLDSMTSDRTTNGMMAMWLEQDLMANSNEWLIAYWHHPPYSKGSHDSDWEFELAQMRQNILPILEEHGVDLVLCGHSHAYERSFLLQGHYGFSSTLNTNTMVLDLGSGQGEAPYKKTSSRGAVYVVAGSSGQISGGALNHPAMFVSLNQLGSVVIDVNTNQLDLKFLRENGTVDDYFTLRHEPPPPPPPVILTRGPYLQSGSSTSVVVRWRTTVPTDSLVRYGSNTNMSGQAFGTGMTNEHEVVITGLAPDSIYFYSVGSSNQQTRTLNYFFRTAPVGSSAFRVWAFGDGGIVTPNLQAMRNIYYDVAFDEQRFANVWLMLGDNAYDSGTDEEYQLAVFDMYGAILPNTFLYPAIGEHDTNSHATEFDYLKIFTLPANGEAGGAPSGTERYYSFNYANAHFICLDSTSDRSGTGAMANWLRQDLATNAGLWTIAYWHHPPYSGSRNSDFEPALIEMRENIVPILEAYGVDLVLGAHSWTYERSKLISGHYGNSGTFDPAMEVDSGGGDEMPYVKIDGSGAVYIVAGSAARVGFGSVGHPAMYRSLNEVGSVLIDINTNRLDARFLRATGEIGDQFTMIKDTTLRITSILLTTNEVALTWNSMPGIVYSVEEAEELAPTNWVSIGPVTASGYVTSWIGPASSTNSSRFYRIRTP